MEQGILAASPFARILSQPTRPREIGSSSMTLTAIRRTYEDQLTLAMISVSKERRPSLEIWESFMALHKSHR